METAGINLAPSMDPRDLSRNLEAIERRWANVVLSCKPVDLNQIVYLIKKVYEGVGLREPHIFYTRSPTDAMNVVRFELPHSMTTRSPFRHLDPSQIFLGIPGFSSQRRRYLASIELVPTRRSRPVVGFAIRSGMAMELEESIGWSRTITLKTIRSPALTISQCEQAACMEGVLTGVDVWAYPLNRAWRELAETNICLVAYERAAVIVPPPVWIKLDPRGRLHSEKGLAVQWSDGWGFASWKGTRIPKEWVVGRMPPIEQILTWPHIEQRWAACDMVGWKNILNAVPFRVADSHPDPMMGTLLESSRLNPWSSVPVKFLKVLCGTGREFVIPMPQEVNTVQEAQNWMWRIPDYDPETRT